MAKITITEEIRNAVDVTELDSLIARAKAVDNPEVMESIALVVEHAEKMKAAVKDKESFLILLRETSILCPDGTAWLVKRVDGAVTTEEMTPGRKVGTPKMPGEASNRGHKVLVGKNIGEMVEYDSVADACAKLLQVESRQASMSLLTKKGLMVGYKS